MGCNARCVELQQVSGACFSQGDSISIVVWPSLQRQNCAWLGKDSTDMGLLTTDGQSVIRTKAVRRIGEEWDATLVLGVEITPSQVLGYR